MAFLSGRLGLETSRIPHTDRQGLLWISRAQVFVESGCVRFKVAAGTDLDPGEYGLPHQTISAVLLGPGSSISHDALRILAHHDTALICIGDNGVRCYSSLPFCPDRSGLARRQCAVWADPETRLHIARRMYGWRFGEIFPNASLDVLRGMEGARLRALYKLLATQYGLNWNGRLYDRANPNSADSLNLAINTVATAMYSCSSIAVYAVGAVPQLGFIHEDSGESFSLDIADLFRTSHTIPTAFRAVKNSQNAPNQSLEQICRHAAGTMIRKEQIIPKMIEKIKEIFEL